MTEIKSDSSEYWNNVYSQFHENTPIRDSVWNEEPTYFFVRLIPFLKHNGNKTIMDAGCGDGRNLRPFIESGFDVIGLDMSQYALGICKKLFANRENLKLINSQLESIPLPPKSVDVLICDHALTHIKDVNRVLDNFHVLLKDGGNALIEFTSHFDSTFGQGNKLSPNEFNQKGVYLRYDTPDDIYKMLHKFEILCFTSEHSTDPPHGPGYIRKERHAHHSYFVVERKRKPSTNK